MRKPKPAGMQEEAPHAQFRHCMVQREVSIFVVAEDRVPGVRQVNPDLVRAAGEQTDLQDAVMVVRFQWLDAGPGPPPARPDAPPPLPGRADVLMQRLANLQRLLQNT